MAQEMDAKDLAAEKISVEVETDKEESAPEGLLVEVQNLLEMWEDEGHEYYKDLQRVVENYTEDGEDEEFDMEEEFEEASY